MSIVDDYELRTQTAQQLRQQRECINSKLVHIQQQISDLAFDNYRTYADAGSTTEYCRKKFGEATGEVDKIDSEIDKLRGCFKEFSKRSDEISEEIGYLKSAESKSSPLWDILGLRSLMDVCIRAGYYEIAYSLTNYGIQLQQHGLTANTAIKAVADKLIDARHYLLDELFNRFAGPIDLASSIQVVNSIRKIPYLSATQLRVSILQYRDLYLEKQLIDIRSQPDFLLRMVEVYRDCMYDTMVLYLAVFPEGEIIKRDPSIDPRWDVWQHCGPSAILSEWAIHNVDAMFDHIRKVEHKSGVDVGVLTSKLMSFAMSFGRMGLDFRPLITNVMNDFVLSRFKARTANAASSFCQLESILIEGDLPEMVMTAAISNTSPSDGHSAEQPTPPAQLSMWDDLCVYGNEILDAFNELRDGLSPMHIAGVLEALSDSLRALFTWLDLYALKQDHQKQFVKALKLLARYFIPYLNACLLVLFPYEKCCRLFYHTTFSLERYESRLRLKISDLYSHCTNAAEMDEIVKPFEQSEKSVPLMLNDEKQGDETISESFLNGQESILPRAVETDNDGEAKSNGIEVAENADPKTADLLQLEVGATDKIVSSTPNDDMAAETVEDEVDFTVPSRSQHSGNSFTEVSLQNRLEQ